LACSRVSFHVFQRLFQYNWGHPIPEWQASYKKRGGPDDLRREKPNEYFPIALLELLVGEDLDKWFLRWRFKFAVQPLFDAVRFFSAQNPRV
jgi:hypothetical protein